MADLNNKQTKGRGGGEKKEKNKGRQENNIKKGGGETHTGRKGAQRRTIDEGKRLLEKE